MALDEARIRIQSGCSKSALVIGASKFSDFASPAFKETAVLWGDGSGAIQLAKSDKPGYLALASLFRPLDLFSLEHDDDGRAYFKMDGHGVYKFAVK